MGVLSLEDIKLNSIEPLMKSRVFVTISEPFNIPKHVVRKVSSISYRNDKWDNIKIEMYNPVVPNVPSLIVEGLEKLKKRYYQTSIFFHFLNPVGDIVSEWEIKGQIKSIDFSDLGWDKNEPIIITFNFEVWNLKVNL